MRGKSIYDPIHGLMEFNDLCLKIIDTPEFQRLRDIKQLGTCYYIFPGASHNRFEHSLGVAYLARKFIQNIADNQPELEINDHLINLIEIAGLCHDLGHGPFSHIFDHKFVKKYDYINLKNHEDRSCKILNHIIHKYQIPLSSQDFCIISELINPIKFNLKHKFLYHIINNPSYSIDVDKLDYIKRDIYNTGIKLDFDYQRLLHNARVINNKIVYSIRVESDIYDLFRIRNELHRRIYTHPVVRSIEFMIVDCLQLVDQIFKISSKVDFPEQFKDINDNILDSINLLTLGNNKNKYILEKCQHIIKDIKERRFYKFIGEIQLNDEDNEDYNYDYFRLSNYNLNGLNESDVLFDKVIIGYIQNPVNKVEFYNQNTKKIISKDQMKKNLSRPDRSYLSILRFYVCDLQKIDLVNKLFKNFNKKYRIIEDKPPFKKQKNRI